MAMKDMSTISVVMATYNGGRYLREQLDSILQQTYPVHEIIIQDDCSTDDTADIVREYMHEHSMVKLFVNEHNLGFSLNFKSAVLKATGDFIAISDQDDVWFPEKLAKQMAAIGTHDVCCSPCYKGQSPETWKLYKYKFSFEHQLFHSIYGHTMLCPRDFLQRDDSWLDGVCFDLSLTIQAYLHRGVVAVQEPLNWHREHANEVTIGTETGKTNKLSPYIGGYRSYRKLQQNANWKLLYAHVFEHTTDCHPLVHRISGLLLKDDMLSLLRLCTICMRHKETIYPTNNTRGLAGSIRAFFFPFIHAYFNHKQYTIY